MAPTRYPLHWPAGWKRTQAAHRRNATFTRDGKSLSVFDGVQRVLQELERLGVAEPDVVGSTNLKTRLDGLPRSDQSRPSDPGACVYWQEHPKAPMRCMAIDRYTTVQDNLAAIAATLAALRAIERHGGAAILDRAFTGFAALPAPTAGSPRDWWSVLGVDQTASADEIRQAHQRLAREHHPDRGGDAARMAEINTARDAGLKGAL